MLSADGGLYIAGGSKVGSNTVGHRLEQLGLHPGARQRLRVGRQLQAELCLRASPSGHKVSITASNVSGGNFRTVTLTCTVKGKSKTDTLKLRKASGPTSGTGTTGTSPARRPK